MHARHIPFTSARYGSSMDAFALLLRDTLSVTAMISLPVLGVATLVGTLIALLQAVTQVQEQTLSVLPKFCVVGFVTALGGHFAMMRLSELLRHCVEAIPLIVASQ